MSSESLVLTKIKNKRFMMMVLGMATLQELHLSDIISSEAIWTRRDSFLIMALQYAVMDPFTREKAVQTVKAMALDQVIAAEEKVNV